MARITRTATITFLAAMMIAATLGLPPGFTSTAADAAESAVDEAEPMVHQVETAEPATSTAEAALSYAPTEGETGTAITVEGEHCFLTDGTTAADGVIIVLENDAGEQLAAATVPVGPDGTFGGELVVPSGVRVGAHHLRGTCVSPELPDLGKYVGGAFTVTGEGPSAVTADEAAAQPAAGGIEAYPSYDGQSTCSPSAKPGTLTFSQRTLAAFTNTGTYGISRDCSIGGLSEHKEGRAWDWKADARNAAQHQSVDKMLNWLLATDAQGNRHANARRLGVMYIIWDRQMFRMYRPDAGWQPYTGSHPHTDHVHISFTRPGGNKTTSYWSMRSAPAWAGIGSEPPPPPEPGPGGFFDVAEGDWFVDGLLWAVDAGVVGGYPDQTFRPVNSTTRAQAVTMLWRAQGEPTVSGGHGFRDVAASDWYDAALDWAASVGVVSGYPDATFRPGNEVTRAQFVSMLWRVAGSQRLPNAAAFPDVESASWYAEAVSWATARGYVQGYPNGTYGPARPIARAELVTVLWRARPFDDVVASDPFAQAVDWARYHGVTTGYGGTHTYQPAKSSTRAEVISILHRVMDSPQGSPQHQFIDVDPDRWYDEALSWATANGVVNGYPDGSFRPATLVNQAQFITMMWRAAGVLDVAEPHGFSGVTPGVWYEAPLRWATAHNIFDGLATFEPNQVLNRGEMAILLYNLASSPNAWSLTTTPPSTLT